MTSTAHLIALTVAALVIATGCSDSGTDRTSASSELSEALAERDGRPEIRVLQPVDGATVSTTFTVEVETTNLQLAPAGATMDGEGHWHLLVDRGCAEPGSVLPSEATAVHFGDGEARAEVTLPPGQRDLCVQVGDGFHVAIDVIDTFSVTVVDDE